MPIRVSVVIPCFNDGQYVKEAIQSVDLKSNSDTEIIVVDDGSDDPETKRVLGEIACERVRVLNGRHGGPSAARNMGIEKAEGRYILPLDADDRIEAEYIQKAAEILEKDKSVGLVYCHADRFGKESGPWKLPDYTFEQMLLDNIVFVTAMFRKEDWQMIGGFSEDMLFGLEDYDFFLGILELGKSIMQLKEVYFHYRIKETSRSTAFLGNIEAVKKTYQDILEHHEELYRKYFTTYAKLLRDEVIQLRYEKQALVQLTSILTAIKKIPFLNWLGHRLLKRRGCGKV